MKVVYKYPLALTDHQVVRLPLKSTVLSVQEQNGSLVIWAVVDQSIPQTDYEFRIVGTGNPFPNDMLRGYQFLGTVQESRRPLVWHVFGKGDFVTGVIE